MIQGVYVKQMIEDYYKENGVRYHILKIMTVGNCIRCNKEIDIALNFSISKA